MSDTQRGTLHGISEGGLSGTHDLPDDSPVLVGPSTAAQFNKIVPAIIPIACWRADDIRFKFASSFVNPEIKAELQPTDSSVLGSDLTSLLKRHPGCPLSVFGHADPVGSDDYNKTLSGRRAIAIYAMLVRDTNLWEHLYSSPFGDDNWGKEVLQTMLDEVSTSDRSAGQPQGGPAEQNGTSQSLGDPDQAHSPDSIVADGGRRKALFAAYMDKLCGPGLKLSKTDFLAQGADADGKGDYQGCGEFNPSLIFSQQDNDKFEKAPDKTERNDTNAPNRRVMVLIFRTGSRVLPSKWPCPRAKEGITGCKKRFWSDGENRRSKRLPAAPRKFDDTQDTFACRFFQRLSSRSPCELIIPRMPLLIRLIDAYHRPMKRTKYTLLIDNLRFDGLTDNHGGFRHMIPISSTTGTLVLENWTLQLDIVKFGGPNESAGARFRFENLGLAALPASSISATGVSADAKDADDLFRRATFRFQSMVDLETDGTLNDATITKLREVYGS